MDPNRPNPASTPRPAVRKHTASRGVLWILAAPALALAATLAFVLLGAPADWTAAAWLLAVLVTIAATFIQALWAGLRHGDWSAFRCEALSHDHDGLDYSSRTGRYAYLRTHATHEALMRDADAYPGHRDHLDPPS